MVSEPSLPANVSRLYAAALPPHNLPPQPTPLLGRVAEVADLQARLRDPRVRLLTLTGPGGTGKSRLALEVAAGLVDSFSHGINFVDLVPVRDPALVPAAITRALNVRETGTEPVLTTLVAALQDKQALLLLDNFDQVLAAAPIIAELLAACPGVTLLVTSRAPLRLRWEQEFPVAPLAVPAAGIGIGDSGSAQRESLADSLRGFAAVELFVQRAQAVRPDFTLHAGNAREVAAICSHLQGLPLAIELAAARVRILPPGALLARLTQAGTTATLNLLSGGPRDLPERQRSLRDTIAWSQDLLSPMEQMVFRRLAVFAGGCTLDAAEAICSDSAEGDAARAPSPSVVVAPTDVLDGLTSLVEKSLLVQHTEPDGGSRFRFLQAMHEFSREQLAGSDEEATLRRRHALVLLGFARNEGRALTGSEQAGSAQRLEQDHHNLRAAMEWALAGGEAELALRICAALTTFWYIKGHYREGRDWCARTLAAAPEGAPAVRAAVLHSAASLADIQHDQVEARSLIEASVALWRSVGHHRGLASSLSLLGMLARHDGDRVMARRSCEEALAIYATSPHPWGQRLALGVLGWVAEDEGDHETARRLLEASLEQARKGQSPTDIALQLNNLGIIAIRVGDDLDSETRHQEALKLTHDVHAHEPMACALEGLAAGAASRRNHRRAAWLLGAATALRAAIGSPRIAQFEEEYDRLLPRVREALGEAVYASAAAEGAAAELHDVMAVAMATGAEPKPLPLHTVADGPRAVPPGAQRPANLTARQVDYLRLLANGHTNKAIAAALVVSETAVEQMLVRLYEKIQVRNRAEAIGYAFDHGLMDATSP